MDLWKEETANKVYLEGESTWTVTATYTKNGVNAGSIDVAWNTTDLRWEATLPYLLDECTVNVVWSFQIPGGQYITKTDSYEIITPLLSRREIKRIVTDATNDDVTRIEAAVRYIIQSHTGQAFGKRTKSRVVVGAGEDAIALPERLLSLTGISTLTATLNPKSIVLIADGWYMKKRWSDAVTTLENDSLYWYGQGYSEPEVFPSEAPHGLGHSPNRFGHGKIISAPGRNSGTVWKDDYPFTITGTWGYDNIPTPVVEAAKLLVNDYACGDHVYRDRYLDSVNASDWQIQFNALAYLQTGNVRADQLLNDFVMKRGWAVI
jgi:hypothetical protein